MKLNSNQKGPAFGAPGFAGRYCSNCKYCVYLSTAATTKTCCKQGSSKYGKPLGSMEGACNSHEYGSPIKSHL